MMPNPSAVPNQPVRAATLDGIGSGESHSAYDDAAWDNGVDPLWVWVLDSGVQPFDGADGATSVTYSSLKLRLDAMWARIRRVKVDASASLDAAVISPIGDDNSGVALMSASGALVAAGARILSWTTTTLTIAKQLVLSAGTTVAGSCRAFMPGISDTVSGGLFVKWDATAGELLRATSKRALKENEREIGAEASDIIKGLRPVLYDARNRSVDRPGVTTDIPGFIAEDLAESPMPGLAVVEPDDTPIGRADDAILAVTVAALKDVLSRLEALERMDAA